MAVDEEPVSDASSTAPGTGIVAEARGARERTLGGGRGAVGAAGWDGSIQSPKKAIDAAGVLGRMRLPDISTSSSPCTASTSPMAATRGGRAGR
jgi:hypothetical protein